jgi:hypothetical protein
MISAALKYIFHIDNLGVSIVRLFSRIVFIGIGGMLLFLSCKDSSSISTQGLNGKWEIYSAQRNGRETPYLRGGYFVFDSKGNLILNITGKEERSPFSIEDNVIVLEGKENYTIASLRNDSMDIHYVMNPENEFMFFLKKTLNENH